MPTRARVAFGAVTALLLALPAGAAHAQSATSAATARLLQGDYAVPDAPALVLLQLEESALLRPTSVKSLGAQLASASDDFSLVPRAFAVEFSPGMLVDGERLSVDDYVRRKLWYRTRLSFAARRGDGAGTRSQAAAALRLGIQDNSDLRTNAAFTRAILALTDARRDSLRLVELTRLALRIPVTDTPTAEQQAAIDREVALQLADRAERTRGLVEDVKRARESALWNADAFDVAVGVRGSSADTVAGSRSRFDGVSAWATKSWGFAPAAQLVVGARGAYDRGQEAPVADHVALRAAGDLVARLYVGSNRYKVFAEAQGTAQRDTRPVWLGDAGGELQLGTLLWASATAGWRSAAVPGGGRVVSTLKLKVNPLGG